MKKHWLELINYIKTRNQGQSMVEYILIISFIAMVLIISVTNFGNALLDLYTDVKDIVLNL